jgi:hypothetical protein
MNIRFIILRERGDLCSLRLGSHPFHHIPSNIRSVHLCIEAINDIEETSANPSALSTIVLLLVYLSVRVRELDSIQVRRHCEKRVQGELQRDAHCRSRAVQHVNPNKEENQQREEL